jgi:GGDEF domain-containing protein
MATAQYVAGVKAAPDSSAAAWREVVHLLAQAAAMHAVHLQAQEVEPLQTKFLQALEQMKGEPSDDLIRRAGHDLSGELERYNKAATLSVKSTLEGLRETVSGLSEGLRALAGQSEVAAHIDTLHSLVAGAQTAAEFEAGRVRIQEIVRLLGDKDRERSSQLNAFVQELQERIKELESRPQSRGAMALATQGTQAAPAQIDALTGIPNGAAAREAVLHAQAGDPLPHLAVIHIQSLDLLNARFGQRIGDQIVLTCCQHLASNLCREKDRIFRWRGPAFIALLERDDSPAGVAREISHVCNSVSSSFFGEPHRSILIPVKMVSSTLPIESRLVTEVFDSIERFIVRAGRPVA